MAQRNKCRIHPDGGRERQKPKTHSTHTIQCDHRRIKRVKHRFEKRITRRAIGIGVSQLFNRSTYHI